MRFRGGGVGHTYMRHFEGRLQVAGWGAGWPPIQDEGISTSDDGAPYVQPVQQNEPDDIEQGNHPGGSGSDADGDEDDNDCNDIEQPELEMTDEGEDIGEDDRDDRADMLISQRNGPENEFMSYSL